MVREKKIRLLQTDPQRCVKTSKSTDMNKVNQLEALLEKYADDRPKVYSHNQAIKAMLVAEKEAARATQPTREQITQILTDNIKPMPDGSGYIIHGAVDELERLFAAQRLAGQSAASLPPDWKERVEAAAAKEEIFERKWGGKDHSGYDTIMLYEVNDHRNECFVKGAEWAIENLLPQPQNDDRELTQACMAMSEKSLEEGWLKEAQPSQPQSAQPSALPDEAERWKALYYSEVKMNHQLLTQLTGAQPSGEQLFTKEQVEDELLGLLYKNKTDEADEGSWIESKDFPKVASAIAAYLQSLTQTSPLSDGEGAGESKEGQGK
jgi:hypothetical protein